MRCGDNGLQHPLVITQFAPSTGGPRVGGRPRLRSTRADGRRALLRCGGGRAEGDAVLQPDRHVLRGREGEVDEQQQLGARVDRRRRDRLVVEPPEARGELLPLEHGHRAARVDAPHLDAGERRRHRLGVGELQLVEHVQRAVGADHARGRGSATPARPRPG